MGICVGLVVLGDYCESFEVCEVQGEGWFISLNGVEE